MGVSNKVVPAFLIILLSVVAMTAFVKPSAAAPPTPTGLVIPLYTYPTDGTWTAVLNAKNAHLTVPFIAVINPNNGPGSALDQNYLQGIKGFQASGIIVLGYVATGYGSKLLTNLENLI